MGKNIFWLIVIFVTTNMWWFCATQFKTVAESPIVIIPFIGTALLVVGVFVFIRDRWDD